MYINFIYDHARTTPDKLAVVNSGEQITYRRFAHSIEAVRNFLLRSPLPETGFIAIATSNLYEDWLLLLALNSMGRTTVAGSSWQVIEGLEIGGISALVCYSHNVAAKEAFEAARPGSPIVEVPRNLAGDSRANTSPPPIPEGPYGDQVIYTSGTTGSYKKVIMRGPELEARLMARTSQLSDMASDDVYYGHNFGQWTAAGYNMPQAAWRFGATVVFDQRRDWGDHFFDVPVNKTFFVPGLLDQVCRMGRSRPPGYPALYVMVGGGFLDARLARELRERLDCEVLAGYGGTEFRACLECIVQDDEDVVWLMQNFSPGIEIVDEKGARVPVGVEGELRIAQVSFDPVEYLGDPESTARHFRDGYFYPGDMAVEREDGRIRILGRVDDVINLAGQKLAIEPFEQSIRSMLEVDSLCAFAQQGEDGQDRLLIVVEGTQLPDRARLQAFARRVKHVSQVRFSLINRFPRGENGMMKVNRRKVLELVRKMDGQKAPANQPRQYIPAMEG